MRVLVTGGTGFTGSHLVRRLLDRGRKVVVVDNKKGLFYQELEKQGAKIELGSVTDRVLMEKLVRRCEVVYHIAAAFRQLNVPNRYYWDVNVEGTRNLVDAAFKSGVRRFVYCSTQGVHGDIKNPPGNESSLILPEDYYQLTKFEGEKVVQEYVGRGFDAVILRPTAIYGPRRSRTFSHLIPVGKTGIFFDVWRRRDFLPSGVHR